MIKKKSEKETASIRHINVLKLEQRGIFLYAERKSHLYAFYLSVKVALISEY